MIIKRRELEEVLKKDRVLLYGRRKTGKTFYTKLKKKDWDYFIVKRGGKFLSEDGTEFDTRTFIRYASKSERIIVDEFHRAREDFFAVLQGHIFPENTILITSTLHFFRKREIYSPIMGLFPEFRVGLISPVDLILQVGTKKEDIERAIIWQEPTQIGKNILESIKGSKIFVQSLVGEILEEEDVGRIERIKEILRAISNGKNTISEIANYLYSQGYIPKPETGLITPYIRTMLDIGLIEKVRVFKKEKRSFYRLCSPLMDFVYYLDAKYSFLDVDLEDNIVLEAWRNKVGIYVEQFFERLLSEALGLIPVKIFDPEIDIALTRFKRLEVVAEVKWKENVKREEVEKVERKLGKIKAKKFLIVPDEADVRSDKVEILTPGILRDMIKEKGL